jgi:hypothetical protein
MLETILLLITLIVYYFSIMTSYWDFGIMAVIVFELVLLSICAFIIINKYMKIREVTPALFLKGAVTLVFMGYLIFLWVFLMTFELHYVLIVLSPY